MSGTSIWNLPLCLGLSLRLGPTSGTCHYAWDLPLRQGPAHGTCHCVWDLPLTGTYVRDLRLGPATTPGTYVWDLPLHLGPATMSGTCHYVWDRPLLLGPADMSGTYVWDPATTPGTGHYVLGPATTPGTCRYAWDLPLRLGPATTSGTCHHAWDLPLRLGPAATPGTCHHLPYPASMSVRWDEKSPDMCSTDGNKARKSGRSKQASLRAAYLYEIYCLAPLVVASLSKYL